jgi:hypothetical protein
MFRLLVAPFILLLFLSGLASADDQAEARAILDKAIKAHGDEAAMNKVLAIHVTSEAECYGLDIGTVSRINLYQQGVAKVDKGKVVFSSSVGSNLLNKVTQVINGKEAWIKVDDTRTMSMSEAEKEGLIGRDGTNAKITSEAGSSSMPDGFYFGCIRSLVPFRKAEYRLSPIGEKMVAGRKVIGICVRHDKHDMVSLYFDGETYLLVKYERRFKNDGAAKEVHEETVLSDYRTIQGFKQPFKMEVYQDGRKFAKHTCLTFEFSEKPFDDKLFAKP